MTTIYLVRHAEAEGNVHRRLCGQTDVDVTPNGRLQIAALEKRFAELHVDAVYSSDLTRTCTTAGAVYKQKQLPLHTDPRFREVYCGIWEDVAFGWLLHFEPQGYYDFCNEARRWRVENSETYEVYTSRFIEAMNEVARKHEGQTICIFSHGMVLRGVQQRLFFPEKDELRYCENTAVTKLLWDNGSYTLEFLNDASHLTEEISTVARQKWRKGARAEDFNLWFRDPEPGDEALLAALNAPKTPQLRIAMRDNTPCGVLCLSEAGEDGELTFLGLLPEHRGCFLATQIVGEAISIFRHQGKRDIVLGTPSEEKVFARNGFVNGRRSLQPKII